MPRAAGEGKRKLCQRKSHSQPRITLIGLHESMVAAFAKKIYYTLLISSAAIMRKSTWASFLIGSSFKICEAWEMMKGQDADSPLSRPQQELVAAWRPRSLDTHLGGIASCNLGDICGQWFSRDRSLYSHTSPILLSSSSASAFVIDISIFSSGLWLPESRVTCFHLRISTSSHSACHILST